jgi:hypothetical protein
MYAPGFLFQNTLFVHGCKMKIESNDKDELDAATILVEENTSEIRQLAKAAMRSFYENPNYAIYSTPQPPEHEQVAVTWGHRRATVDKGIADVIVGLWQLDFDTLGSCEQRPSGKAYVLLPVPGQGHAFIDLISKMGISAEFQPKIRTVQDSSNGRERRIPGGNVIFDPIDIPKVVSILRAAIVQNRLSLLANCTIIVSPNS